MKVILAPPECDPSVQMECDCGEKFWIDPCDGDNLIISEKSSPYMVPICPKCGKIENES